MTAQVPERLRLDGEDVWMTFCPPLPRHSARLVRRSNTSSEQSIIMASTACWRQYQGSWAIDDDRFYLLSVAGVWELKGDEPLLADWFTGVLRVPRGEKLRYVHLGFATVFEEELHLEVEEGRVIERRVVDNRERDLDGEKPPAQDIRPRADKAGDG